MYCVMRASAPSLLASVLFIRQCVLVTSWWAIDRDRDRDRIGVMDMRLEHKVVVIGGHV